MSSSLTRESDYPKKEYTVAVIGKDESLVAKLALAINDNDNGKKNFDLAVPTADVHNRQIIIRKLYQQPPTKEEKLEICTTSAVIRARQILLVFNTDNPNQNEELEELNKNIEIITKSAIPDTNLMLVYVRHVWTPPWLSRIVLTFKQNKG